MATRYAIRVKKKTVRAGIEITCEMRLFDYKFRSLAALELIELQGRLPELEFKIIPIEGGKKYERIKKIIKIFKARFFFHIKGPWSNGYDTTLTLLRPKFDSWWAHYPKGNLFISVLDVEKIPGSNLGRPIFIK